MRCLLVLGALLAGLPAWAAPYIYLSTPHLYGPEERVEVSVDAEGAEQLVFRLYRVPDPLDFFTRQADPHSYSPRHARVLPSLWRVFGDVQERTVRDARYRVRTLLSERSRHALRIDAGLATMTEDAVRGPRPARADLPLLSEWRVPVPADEYYSERLALGTLEPGTYLLEANAGRTRATVPVVVTRLALITKQYPGGMLVYACDRQTGAPARGSEVFLRTDTTLLGRGRTNWSGFWQARLDTNSVYAFARRGPDIALAESYSYTDQDARGTRVYFYTERPIYRPGQVVYFKGVVRERAGAGWRYRPLKNLPVEVRDARGNRIYERTVTPGALGTFSDSLTLSEIAPLGRYTISAEIEKSYHSVQFRVEEYRKPEYQVQVTLDRPYYLAGDVVSVSAQATYFFGSPVTNAPAVVRVYRARFFDDWTYDNELVREVTVTTDGQGHLTFTVPTAPDSLPFQYQFTVAVTDRANRAETGQQSVRVWPSELQVKLAVSRYVLAPGAKVVLTLTTTGPTGTPASAPVEVAVVGKDDRVERILTATTDVRGNASIDYYPSHEGSLRLVARVHDRAGRVAQATEWLWVTRGGYFDWSSEEIKVLTDRKSYAPGQVAEVFLLTPVPHSTCLLTLETDRILERRLVRFAGNSVVVRLKVRGSYAPNVHLVACQVARGTFYQGRAEVSVALRNELLSVVVTPEHPTYEPGAHARFRVLVRDARGRPVQGEFSLGVVDEAIYALAAEIAPPITDYFYGAREDVVHTSSSAYFSFYGYTGSQFDLGALRRDDAVRAAYKGTPEPVVRSRFKDTAFWLAALATDRRGEALVEFDLPDNLTTWRATCQVLTADGRVGRGVARTIARKDLMARLVLPRSATERDSLDLGLIVHNEQARAGECSYALTVRGAGLLRPDTGRLFVPAYSSARVDLPVRFDAPGRASFRARVQLGAAQDGLELPLPVRPHGLVRTAGSSGFLAGAATQTCEFVVPPEASRRSMRLEAVLNPTFRSALFAGLHFLAAYPYGCVEQTMSSFLPDLICRDLINRPGLGDTALARQLPLMIRKGIDRLLAFQHSDGGFGWWQDDATDPFMTAYALEGLILARGVGERVPANAIDNAARSLVGQLEDNDLEPVTRALGVYVLAAAGRSFDDVWPRQQSRLTEAELTPYGQALVAMALARWGKLDLARTYLDRLRRAAVVENGLCRWTGRVPHAWQDDPIEITATALRALLMIEPRSPLISQSVHWLLRQRQGAAWKSTKDSALVLWALAQFLAQQGARDPDFEVAITVNGGATKSLAVNSRTRESFSAPVVLDASALAVGRNRVEFRTTGTASLFYSVVASYYSEEENVAAGGTGEVRVTRRFFRLTPTVEGRRTRYLPTPLTGALTVGDPVLVVLNVEADRTEQYLMVEDPLPAGCEVELDDERYPIARRSTYQFWGGREVHDDRVAFFLESFGGTRELSYIIVPNIAGRVHVLPAVVSLMYFPEVRGNSREDVLSVRR